MNRKSRTSWNCEQDEQDKRAGRAGQASRTGRTSEQDGQDKRELDLLGFPFEFETNKPGSMFIYHSPSPSSKMSRYLAIRKISLATWMSQT
jgi:hypothetical protein